MTSRPDFIAGNTRLRARLPALLTALEYDQIARLPREAAVQRLLTSVYRPYMKGDQAEEHLLLGAIGQRLRDLLRGLRGLYGGNAGSVVGVLLARHDLHDTLALLRGARTRQPVPDRLAAVMAVGVLDQRAAVDVASGDGATAVLRLTTHRLPDPATARSLPAAWERYELNADPDEFETAVAATAVNGWTSRLKRIGKPAGPVLDLVHAECDCANLLAALRDPAMKIPHLLPAGRIAVPALVAARRGDPRQVVTARPGWREALDRHADDGDLTVLEWALQSALWRQGVRGLRRGDPLGADVPLGYVMATECEARSVRLLLAGSARAPDARSLLVG